MRIERADPARVKGWYVGPWNSDLAVSIGYANEGVEEPHVHTAISEVYLAARGTTVVRVETHSVSLTARDILVVESEKAHTFLDSSLDYFHFVLHTPGLAGDRVRTEKYNTSRERLGLNSSEKKMVIRDGVFF